MWGAGTKRRSALLLGLGSFRCYPLFSLFFLRTLHDRVLAFIEVAAINGTNSLISLRRRTLGP